MSITMRPTKVLLREYYFGGCIALFPELGYTYRTLSDTCLAYPNLSRLYIEYPNYVLSITHSISPDDEDVQQLIDDIIDVGCEQIEFVEAITPDMVRVRLNPPSTPCSLGRLHGPFIPPFTR